MYKVLELIPGKEALTAQMDEIIVLCIDLFCFRGVFPIRAMSFVKRHKDDDGKRGT